jgi:quercetin dioxygenase-like cupin family protein
MRWRVFFVGVLGTMLGSGPLSEAVGQEDPIQRTTLQTQPFPGRPLHTVTMRVEVAPGAEVAPHTHPGIEMAYVAAGHASVRIARGPATPVAIGDSFSVMPHTVHSVRSDGDRPLVIISTYVVEMDLPLSTPSP